MTVVLEQLRFAMPAILAGLVAGGAIGLLHFSALRWSTRKLLGGESAVLALLAQFVRLAVTGAALFLLVRAFGAAGLISAALAITLARVAVTRIGAVA